ncbi:unnamed protein product [Allacma fusca]|uniref:Short-chain dehydrogenase/reductase 3 n=1 Tax=Allacma fusca TaxID=39272 RepID=A0A8J2L7T9_9HEXA|nr:unnamed protein product [Allacma fusca]
MPSITTGRGAFGDFVYLITSIFGAYFQYLMGLMAKPPLKSLDREIILITGAGNGIGREMCLYLGETCPKVTLVCWDIMKQSNDETVNTLQTMGVKAYGYNIDISNRERVSECAAQVREDVGDVTVIINNAGVLHKTSSFLNLTPTDIERTFNVNTISQCWILREFLPNMVERNSGHVITICSTTGHMGVANFSLYSASKCAQRGLIESISLEMESKNVHINFTTVFPGFINTQLIANTNMSSSLPMPMRTLEPKEVAKEIIEAFRRNEEHVYLPRGNSRLLVLINNLLLPKGGNVLRNLYTFESTEKQ